MVSVVSAVASEQEAVSAVEWEVSEEGLVSVTAAVAVALADHKVVDTAEMVVLEAVAQEAAAMELALEAGSVDQGVDMAEKPADTAVDPSVDATQEWARLGGRRVVHSVEWKEVVVL